MLEAMKNLQSGNIDLIDNQKVKSLLRWCSNPPNTLQQIEELNQKFYSLPVEMVKYQLMLIRRLQPKYYSYPKPTKFSNTKYEVLGEVLKKKYKWSNYELLQQRALVINMLNDVPYLQTLADESGMEDKELRKLGLKAIKIIKPKKQESKSLFSF